MKLYARILSYLGPHAGVLAVAVLCTFAFATLDAFSLVLLIPFLDTIFTGERAAGDAGSAAGGTDPGVLSAGSERLEAILHGTVGRVVDLGGDPLQAVQGIILFILAVFLVKNVFDFVRAYLVARVEQGVTRD
ncbi:MAG: hypothetical protein PVI57_22315, partial [Gemmatimonadota bacterium]